MEEFLASKVHLQPATCNLTYWEVSQQMYIQTLLASLAVVIGKKFSPFVGGEEGTTIRNWVGTKVSDK